MDDINNSDNNSNDDDSSIDSGIDNSDQNSSVGDDDDDDSDLAPADADHYEPDWPGWHKIGKLCPLLRKNQIEVIHDLSIYNDALALQFGGCLMSNWSLKTLELVIWDDVSTLGSQALARGILDCAAASILESVSITTADMMHGLGEIPAELSADGWSVLWNMCKAGLNVASELDFCFPCGDVQALRIGCALMNGYNLKLKKLTIDDISFATDRGVTALLDGVQASRITHLELHGASLDTCRSLSSKGILQLPTLCHLTVVAGDDVHANKSVSDWNDHAEHELGTGTTTTMIPCPREAQPGARHHPAAGRLEVVKLFMNESGRFTGNEFERFLETMSENKNLKRLTLCGHILTDMGVAHLVESWSKWPMLVHLDVCRSEVGATGLSHLMQVSSQHPRFKSLNLGSNPAIGQEGLSSIAAELINGMKSSHLQNLCLNECGLTDCDIKVLSKGLIGNNNSSFKSLNLANNKIQDAGVSELVVCLESGLELDELYLSSNPITAVGVLGLLKVSSACACLKKLEVRHSEPVSYPDLVMIANGLSTCKLLSTFTVQVDRDKIDAADKNTPKAKAQQQDRIIAGRALVNAVKANMHLRKLSLPLIDIPRRSKKEIKFFLNLEASGRHLLRLDDGLNPFGLWGHVLAKCCANTSVLFYLLGEQPWLIPCPGKRMGTEKSPAVAKVATSRKRPLTP